MKDTMDIVVAKQLHQSIPISLAFWKPMKVCGSSSKDRHERTLTLSHNRHYHSSSIILKERSW